MKFVDKFKNIVTVEIQGFFNERFINICKINNIKIWDIINITNGVIRFKMYANEYKSLKKVARKTKCKVKIKSKKGMYFTIFKYRKRKWIFGIVISLILILILSTTFIWTINIEGNNKLTNEEVLQRISKYGVNIGKNKFLINKNQLIKDLRVEFGNTAWVGLEIAGTSMNIKFIEKIEVKNVLDERNGDIISNVNGVLTKVIPENGTAVYKVGSYIEKGMVVIKGSIYSEFVPERFVHAKGIVKANVEYVFEKEYKFKCINKDYIGNKYNIGFSLNNSEKYIDYLNKNKKYDKLKYSFNINLFNIDFSLDWYKYKEYNEVEVLRSKDELIQLSNVESKLYIDEVFKTIENPIIEKQDLFYEETFDGIKVRNVYIINQDVGEFIERN